MARSIYVMPLVTIPWKDTTQRVPKYRDSLFPTLTWSMFYYGDEPSCLVGIQDVDAATDASLTAQPDVFGLPANLDQTMSTTAVRNTVRSRLEGMNVPGTWVQTDTTYREVVRVFGACCQFAERYAGLTGGLWFTGGVTLDTTFSLLPAAARQGILGAASSFGFDTTGFTGTSTLRAIIKSAADQYLATQPPLELPAGSQL